MSVPLPEKGSLNLQLSLPSLQQIMEHCIALSLWIRMSLDGLWDIGVRVIQGIHRGNGALDPDPTSEWPREAGSSLACGQECEATLAPECIEAQTEHGLRTPSAQAGVKDPRAFPASKSPSASACTP